MKDFAKKIFRAAAEHPYIAAGAFILGLVIGCILLLATQPELVREVMK